MVIAEANPEINHHPLQVRIPPPPPTQRKNPLCGPPLPLPQLSSIPSLISSRLGYRTASLDSTSRVTRVHHRLPCTRIRPLESPTADRAPCRVRETAIVPRPRAQRILGFLVALRKDLLDRSTSVDRLSPWPDTMGAAPRTSRSTSMI